MKQLFVVFFLLHTCIIFSQSFAGVFVGVDYAQIRVDRHNLLWLSIDEKGYAIKSLVYGIQGEKKISSIFSIVLKLSFTKKEFDADVGFLVPIKGLVFKSYRGDMSLKWFIRKNWYVAPGVSLNYLSDVYWYFEYNRDSPSFFSEGKKEIGGRISTGYIYKNISIDLSFNKGFFIGNNADKPSINFKPINSFGLSLGYQFQLSKEKRRK